MDVNNLESAIMKLSKEEAFEAALFFAKSVNKQQASPTDLEALLKPITEKPLAYLQQHEQLAKVLLLYGAQEEAYRPDVEKAIQGTGQKQNIITDQNVVQLALVCLGALIVILRFSKPDIKAEETTTEVGGKTTTKKKYEESYKMDDTIKAIIDGIKEIKK